MTPEVQGLREVLRRVALRLGAGAAVRMLARAAAAGSTGLLAWALVTLVLPVPFPLSAAAAAAALILAAASPALVWRLRPSLLVAARVADRRLGLADRLGTAVELLSRPGPPTGLARLQISDAVAAARTVAPRAVAPIRTPREAWVAAAGCALLAAWAQFLLGWSLPGTPAARTLAVIHREGRALEEMGRRLDAAGRARGLPAARRAAPQVEELGRRLEAPRMARQDAVALLREAGRQLAAAQEMVERRLLAALPKGAGAPDLRTSEPPDSAQRLQALEEAVRQIRAVTGQLRTGGAPADRADLSRRFAALSDSLDQVGAPPAARKMVARARQEAERDRLSVAAGMLGDALQDLQSVERMLGDEQALGEARREVQRSAERIAEGGPLGASAQVAEQGPSETAPPKASGPNPVSPGTDEDVAPPPGPNQGSLPGEGTGGALGSPTSRLEGTRVPVHLGGIPGEGSSSLKEITAPGQVGTARLPAARPPAEVTHEIDRALSQEPLPPAYLTIVRRYFETPGGSP